MGGGGGVSGSLDWSPGCNLQFWSDLSLCGGVAVSRRQADLEVDPQESQLGSNAGLWASVVSSLCFTFRIGRVFVPLSKVL